MMLSEFWQAIVGSAVISTIISNLCLWWHKKNDYKRDYYKKIIDKRMAAYENLAGVVARTGLRSMYSITNEVKEIYVCFESLSSLQRTNEDIMEALSEVHWYSPQIYQKFVELNGMIAGVLDREYKDKLQGKIWGDNDFRKIGVEEYCEFKKVLSEIKTLSIEDRMNLDKVEEFFGEQKEQI